MSLDADQLPPENRIPMRVYWIHGQNPIGLFGHDPYYSMWRWCERFCTGKFDCTLPTRDRLITWLFENAADATMFRLRWCDAAHLK